MRKKSETANIESSINDSSAYAATSTSRRGGGTKNYVVFRNERENRGHNDIYYDSSSSNSSSTCIKCYKCGGVGHLKAQCPSKNVFIGKCNICNVFGHKANTCPKNAKKHRSEDLMGNKSGKAYTALSVFLGKRPVDEWICDSGTSNHMTGRKDYFENFEKFAIPVNIKIADGSVLKAIGTGDVRVQVHAENRWYDHVIEHVWYVPGVSVNLFSVKQATTNSGLKLIVNSKHVVFCKENRVRMVGFWADNAYVMDFRFVKTGNVSEVCLATSEDTLQAWHERMGHQDKRHVAKVYVVTVFQCMKKEACSVTDVLWENHIVYLTVHV